MFMMTLNNEEFLDSLERDSSLRLKLLNDLNKITYSPDLDELCRFHHIRSNIPSLYAQYEGFMKHIFNTIPFFIRSIDKKSFSLNPIFLSLYISISSYNNKDLKFNSYLKIVNDCINNYYDIDSMYLNELKSVSIVVPHDKDTYMFLEMFNFRDTTIDFFRKHSFKIKVYYKRRNGIIHGSTNDPELGVFSLNDTITDKQFESAIAHWEEEYHFIKEVISQMKECLYDWVQNEKYATNS